MNKLYLTIISLLCGLYLPAQVTVGSTDASQKFSVLEVISTQATPGGVRLPQLTTAQRNTLSEGQTFRDEQGRETGLAPGLTIYNTTIGCIEYWDGERWVSMCEQQEQTIEPENPEAIPVGKGTFSGKTCFDVVEINDAHNDGGPLGCALLADRILHKVNFSNRSPQDPNGINGVEIPYTGVQVYTFTPSGTVSKVRFEYIDESGIVIESMTPDGNYAGNNISTACKVTVAFYASLQNTLKGLTNQNSLKAYLYVIYNDKANGTGTERKIRITLNLQDCICCGAKTAAGGWLNFMCFNLGADENNYPFHYFEGANQTVGTLYQWGRPKDGHQLRNSPTTANPVAPTLATNNSATLPVAVEGRFILNTTGTQDWRQGGGNNARWGNGTDIANPPKAANDPCPDGWKIPSQAQWASIGRPTNAWSWFPESPGYVIGEMLYLPAGGRRPPNFVHTPEEVGTNGYYWSSTVISDYSYCLGITNTTIQLDFDAERAYGASVRCVEE